MTDSVPPRSESPSEDDSSAAVLGGKYRIERVIGEGAFGRVYLAVDPLLRRNVAIKELLANRDRTDHVTYERYLERFQREARAAGQLTHPNIVAVYELAIDLRENYYLVMEYVDGTDLRDLLAQVGTLPVERAVGVALDVARALEAVHDRDIVHRDLKPANIMMTRRGVTKLTDFGIAQVGHESMRTQIESGHPGTPIYMSPEQASGNGYVDGRSDLYSLGLILYEMLVGEPFLRRRQPLSTVHPEFPAELVRIVNSLTEPDVAHRYQDAAAVVRDLQQLAGVLTGGGSVYQLPGIGQTPSGQPVLPPTRSQFPPPDAIGGLTPPYNAPRPSVSTPQPWTPPPRPTAPPQPGPQIERLSKLIRVMPNRAGYARYVINYRAIGKRCGLIIAIYLVAFTIVAAISGAFTKGTVAENVFIGIAAIMLLLFPVALLAPFFFLRARAKRALRTMT